MTVHHKVIRNPASHFIGLTLFDFNFIVQKVYTIKNRGLQDTNATKKMDFLSCIRKSNNLLKFA
jgi:hypothetical protein